MDRRVGKACVASEKEARLYAERGASVRLVGQLEFFWLQVTNDGGKKGYCEGNQHCLL